MKIGYALGGGGAKGFAHIGVIRVLAEAGIHADVVAGTSMGSLVGAIYASGNLSHLEREARDIKLTDIPLLLGPAWSLSGLFSGKNVLEVLSSLLDVETFEELKIPFAALSVDLNTSSRVTLTKGSLREALRASISIPAVFTPVLRENQLLVDGGTLEPLPVETARSLGADLVIAVDLFGSDLPEKTPGEEPKGAAAALLSAISYLKTVSAKLPWGGQNEETLRKSGPTPTLVDIIERTLVVSQRELTQYRLGQHPADVIIRPAVSDIGLLDFHRGALGIERGVEAARDAVPVIKVLLDSL